ncbi:hypothetical protein D9619_008212 [Psilocybe cf. subviscida]|uniref:Uncharacterized protein n=1 Tax=Psilocybe cf. subviscida TaxID=2480587 RepID=A0A8H5ESM8_9AGAR|nr:hypothetical protein D9619_008212 [Psilocybe cf. subviscida]
MAKLGLVARFLRWFNNFFWPGDYDRDSAKASYKAYVDSKDVASLDTAIANFQLAIDQYRKHKSPSLVTSLINCAVAVWRHYEDCGRPPKDLDMVIRLDTEARDSWSDDKNSKSYAFLLNALATAYSERYQRAFGASPVNPDEKKVAFEEAIKSYTELKDHPAAGSMRSAAKTGLGIILRMRCEFEQTLDRLEVGVQQLQDALLEATEAGEWTNAGAESDIIDDIKATCLFNLAALYSIRYELMKDSKKIHDLNIAIDYNTRAKPLLEGLRRPELLHCMFNLARQLWLRWRQTRDQNDYDAAKQMAEAVKCHQALDKSLEPVIDHILSVLAPSHSLQNRIDDLLLPSRRQSSVVSNDGSSRRTEGDTIICS